MYWDDAKGAISPESDQSQWWSTQVCPTLENVKKYVYQNCNISGMLNKLQVKQKV